MKPPSEAALRALGRRLSALTSPPPRFALVLGSGFKSVAEAVSSKRIIPYSALPGFPRPSVPGHEGRLICGELEGLPLWVLSGRSHFYEGHSMDVITYPIRVLAAAGVTTLLLTNAAGGIRKGSKPGDFMRLTDHINFMGVNPLRGTAYRSRTPFVDVSQAYDPGLGKSIDDAARDAKVRCFQGVYVAVSGPSYETPAEIRAFQHWGADAVGMSTVPEVIVARQLGLRVGGLSCITNAAAGLGKSPVSHEEVLEMGRKAGASAVRLISALASRLREGLVDPVSKGENVTRKSRSTKSQSG